MPTFKKKFKRERFRYPQGFELDQERSRIKLPKLGWVKYIHSREVLGKIANVTISLHAGTWLISIQTEREVPQPVPRGSSAVGVEVGVVNFAALSDGGVLAPLNSFRRHEKRLARESRKLSRQKKNSNNWKKQKNRIARLHAHIANGRKDFLHKATTQLCKNHAVIVIEDIKVRNMTKSARGTVEESGRRVRQKSGLNKAILDQATSAQAPAKYKPLRYLPAAGRSSGDNSPTRQSGLGCNWWLSLRTTPVKPAQPVAMSPLKIARHKPSLLYFGASACGCDVKAEM